MKYIKTLDSFRTFAVLLVIISHWFPPDFFLKKLPLGAIGVTMFFVLSGFLITTILLNSRESLTEKRVGIGQVLRTFYIRRTLRIFPVYYLFLFLIFCFYRREFDYYHNSLYWCLLYASNIFTYRQQDFIGCIGHVWSLAVEEQFYLIWPIVILLTKRKHLFGVISVFVFAAILIRIGHEILQPDKSAAGFYLVLTPTCFDAFGIGGLLSLFKFEQVNFVAFGIWLKRLVIVAVPLFILTFAGSVFSNILMRLSISLLSVWLIFVLVVAKPGIITKLFSNPILTYLGKISYGLYLWHNPIPVLYPQLSIFLFKKGLIIPFTKYCILPYVGGYLQIVIYFVLLITISSLSWFLFEKPINNLKRKFTYNEV